MKTLIVFLTLIVMISLAGCEKQLENPEVETYINQLKSNSYTSYELPAFKPSDIPAILKFRNETLVIKNFPRNGISSLWMSECSLGMYALWTIESVRAVEIQSKYLIGRFPSQNPILALISSTDLQLVYDLKSQKVAAKAYNDWWYSVHLFKDKMKIDPLKDTDYRWH